MSFYKNTGTNIKLFDSACLSGHRDLVRRDIIAINEIRRFSLQDGREILLKCTPSDRDLCFGCWLHEHGGLICPECSGHYRDDHQSVVFKEVKL